MSLDELLTRRAFRKHRAAFFADAGQVLGEVDLKPILQQMARINAGQRLGIAFEEIEARFSAGASVSDSFGELLPRGERQALKGWDSASSDTEIAEGFTILGALAGAMHEVSSAARGAVTTAIAQFGAAGVLLYIMSTSVYPSFAQQFPVERWPFYGRVPYFLITSLFSNGPLLLIASSAALSLYVWSLPRWVGPTRERLDKTPIYGWYRSIQSLKVLLTLALHLRGRRGLTTSLRIVEADASPWEAMYLERMASLNASGAKAETVFDVGFFDRAITNRIVLLSRGSSPEQAIAAVAVKNQEKLLKEFAARVRSAGVTSKNVALLIGALPLAAFFATVGYFIVQLGTSGFKG